MKKIIIIAALAMIGVSSFAQHKSVKIDTAKKTVKVDSVTVSVADLKGLLQSFSSLINNSSDITTKQANAKGGLNEVIAGIYFKYFPKDRPKQ